MVVPHRLAQQEIAFARRGGKRRGAGRKPNGARAGGTHAKRPVLSGREPVLITLKVRPHVWSLRARRAFDRVMRTFVAAQERFGTRLVHFSVQRDHIHLIAEAVDETALSRSVQGLAVRIARTINRLMARKGKVFADRFHERVLATPRQTRHALQYVLLNASKHGIRLGRREVDPCSSASAFDGWDGPVRIARALSPPVLAARTWLLRIAWRRGGPLDPAHVPGAIDRRRGAMTTRSWAPRAGAALGHAALG
jgi:REP element-mobilizing transposase RayT